MKRNHVITARPRARATDSTVGQPDPPVAAFSSDVQNGAIPLTVQFTDESTGAPTSWEWDFGDGATSALQNPSHVYDVDGTYTVTLTARMYGGYDAEVKTNYITATP